MAFASSVDQQQGKYATFVNEESEDVSLDEAAASSQRKQDPTASSEKAPHAGATWTTAAQLMVADVVGVGVLTLATAMADLGWVLGLTCLLLFFPLNVYTGLLLWKVKKYYPRSVTYFHMMRALFPGNTAASAFCGVIIYVHLVTVLGDYVLVLGQSLGLIFYDHYVCKPWWILWGCLCIIPFHQLRLLNEINWLCWLNMATITAAVLLSLGYLISLPLEEARNGAIIEAIPHNLAVKNFARAFSKFAFAYAGQFLYLEIMSEMKEPNHFPRTFLFAGNYQVGMYLLVACVGYYTKGDGADGLLVQYLPFGNALRAASLLLFVHMIVTYLVKATVVTRAIHLYLSPKHVNDKGIRGKAEWFAISSALLGMSFIIGNSVPFFDELTGLIGASVVPIACWNIPIAFYIKMCSLQGIKIHKAEWLLLGFLFLLGITLVIVGTLINAEDIITRWEEFGNPFECHCDSIWNTCACSPDHTGMNCSAV